MKKFKKVSFWNLCFMSVMGGILAGTVWANLLGGELLKQIGCFDGISQVELEPGSQEQRQLWGFVLRQRLGEMGFGGLLAMTPIAVPGYLVLAFGAGMSMALAITVFTLEKGWMGLGFWLGSILPHGPCYAAMWLVFATAVKEGRDLKTIRIWILAVLLAVGGCCLEVWVNPWLAGRIF